MGTYLVRFTPLEPYFFGNERSFGNRLDENKTYFITSNAMPSQSTLLGTLRYCCIKHPTADFTIGENDNIGKESFDLQAEHIQSFGVIKHISPVFLMDVNGFYYIPVPYNHKASEKVYTPFSDYKVCQTNRGEQRIPVDYEAKKGIASGFLQINGSGMGTVETGFIKEVVRIGINKNQDTDGMFRKAFRMLKENCSFAVLAEIDKKMEDRVVCMGKNKSMFKITFESPDVLALDSDNYALALTALVNNIIDCLKVYNKEPLQVALSDIYIQDSMDTLYKACTFACIQTRDHRSFKTIYGKKPFAERYKKGERLQNMIMAGSFFNAKNKDISVMQPWENCANFKNCQQAGYNFLINTAKKFDAQMFL